MPPIDYMKVLDIAALTLEASSHIEFQALDLKLYTAVFTREDIGQFTILVKMGDYDLELSFDIGILEKKEFLKWLHKFEYQLEQNFFKNISIEYIEAVNEYKIKILF